MAFVSSPFLGASVTTREKSSLFRYRSRKCSVYRPRAMASGPQWTPFIFRQDDDENRDGDQDYTPFDGSMPLLPPWRPPTIEADFRYNAQRIISRESKTAAQYQLKKIVKVESRAFGTLFAEVVQEVEPQKDDTRERDQVKKLWLRPLLLDGDEAFMDLRGGSDLVLDAGKAVEIDDELRTRVTINLLATEGDMVSRVVSDEGWGESTSKVLMLFVKSLSPEE